MPKLKCICNYVIDLGEVPSSNQLLIISDVEFDKFQETVDSEDVYMKMKIVVHCKVCGRLHIFWEGFDKEPTIYKVETSLSRGYNQEF